MGRLSDDQVRLQVFKAAMRDYFYGSDDVMKAFLIPTDDQLRNEIFDKDAIAVNKNARDRAFEQFFRRVMGGVVLKEDGTPYPKKSQFQIADDFISGKGIVFRGTDTEGFVSFKAPNGTHMAFYNANKTALEEDMPHSLLENNSLLQYKIETKYDPASPEVNKNFMPENMDPEMPKGGSFWNKIVKAFTGHPSQRWAKYENYQKHQLISTAKTTAEIALQGIKELSEEKVKEYQKDAVHELHKAANKKEAQKNVEKFENSLNEVQNKYQYDQETKSVKKLSTEAFQKRRQEQTEAKKAAEEKAAQEKLDAELKAKKELEEREAKLKKAAEKRVTIKNSVKRSSEMRKVLESANMQKIANHKTKASDVYYKFVRVVNNLALHGEPDAPKKMTEDDMINSLTTVYLVGEMMSKAGDGYYDYGEPESNEMAFGALADEVLGKSNVISNQIKSYIKQNGLAKEFIEHPISMEQMLFKDSVKGMSDFIGSVRKYGNSEQIIEKACEDNKNMHMAKEKANQGRVV